MEWHGLGGGGRDIGACHVERFVCCVGFRRDRQIDGGLRQRQIALRNSEKMHGLLGGHGLLERARIGQADVFDGHAHQAPCDVQAVLAGLEHAGQPVEGGIGIARAHRFVQR